MAVDNLLAADVVTLPMGACFAPATMKTPICSGRFAAAAATSESSPGLNSLHPVGPEVLSGLIVYSQGRRSRAEAIPALRGEPGDDTNVWTVMRKAPPLPFLPPEAHGTDIIAFCVFHAGDPEVGRRTIEPLRKLGTVLGEFIAMQPYAAWQQTFDALLAPGARNYWKSHNFSQLSDGAIDVAVKYVQSLPSPQCEIFFGLTAAPPRSQTRCDGYSHRDAIYVCNVHGRWETAPEDRDVSTGRGFTATQHPMPQAACT
jgi:hypothetical protein